MHMNTEALREMSDAFIPHFMEFQRNEYERTGHFETRLPKCLAEYLKFKKAYIDRLNAQPPASMPFTYEDNDREIIF